MIQKLSKYLINSTSHSTVESGLLLLAALATFDR